MKYLVMVSHGQLAEGLANALSMLAGQREDVLAFGLKEDMSAEAFALEFSQIMDRISMDDEIILLGDIIGGSPLTTAMNVLTNHGVLARTTVMGGMNLPLALTTVLMKDSLDRKELVSQVIVEAKNALKVLEVETDDEEDEI